MTTEQMKAFVTLATCLNFTEAANQLHISQPALSRQISGLESELNLLLLFRDKRSVRLTPAGEVFLDKIKDIYAQYCDAVSAARIAQWGVQSHLRIGILDGHVISGLFPQLINRLERQYSNMHIELFRGSFRRLTDELYGGSADIIITLEFSIRDMERLLFLPISKTEDYLVMSRKNPLSKLDRITMADMKNQVLIAISEEDSPLAYNLMKDMRSKIGCFLPQKDAPSLETCTLWTQAGLGITVLNSHNALAQDPDMKFVPLERVEGFVPLSSDLDIVWHRDNTNHALRVFIDALRDMLKSSPLTPPPPVGAALD